MSRNSERKSFCNHLHNGVNLVFPNGNWISTIWGRGSYSDNHNFGNNMEVTEAYRKLIEDGSSTVEIMIGTENKRLYNKIYRKLDTDTENGAIGWVTMDNWMWVINQLYKMK